ncbi:MAG: hypothetical protein J07HX5_02068 [halophilic archaeon J07HX5]|jgi:hypothetical protein|nr:MAG: hypothetical protein J07HX5_02068 [halophilic archaeon J07HX5]
MSDDAENTQSTAVNTDPVGSFETLGHELRLAVIKQLAARQRANEWEPISMSFGDLRAAVGADDSGQFNYHLSKLVGPYVEQTDEGYVLTPAGYEVSAAVLAGSHAESEIGPVEGALGYDCPLCETRLRAHYDDGYVSVLCPEDGYLFGNTVPPAAVVGHDIETVVILAVQDLQRTVETAAAGVCPECYSNVKTTLPTESPRLTGDTYRSEDGVYARFECDYCGLTFDTRAATVILGHPAVVSFYYDHDVDVRERGYTETKDTVETVLSEDPPRTQVELNFEDDRLVAVLDGDARLVEAERQTTN